MGRKERSKKSSNHNYSLALTVLGESYLITWRWTWDAVVHNLKPCILDVLIGLKTKPQLTVLRCYLIRKVSATIFTDERWKAMASIPNLENCVRLCFNIPVLLVMEPHCTQEKIFTSRLSNWQPSLGSMWKWSRKSSRRR